MDILEVVAKPRKEVAGSAGRQLRAQGHIPAVLYGRKMGSANLSIDAKSFEKGLQQLRGENVMIDLAIEGSGEKTRVFLRDVQRDPVSDALIHVDLLRIDETQKMHFSVPVHHVGTPIGVKEGGILDQHLRTLDIKCLPANLPSHIDADVSRLGIHHALHVSEIIVPDMIEIQNPPTDVVFNVLAKKKVEEEVVEEEKPEGEEEPEVIDEKKKEKE